MLVPHLKQAWRRFLVKELWMDEGSATTAMKIGLLDLLSVIPQEEVIEYGIPFLHSLLEAGKEQKLLHYGINFGHTSTRHGYQYSKAGTSASAVNTSSW